VVGYTIDAVFSEASDRNAVCMAVAAANNDARSVFTFEKIAAMRPSHEVMWCGHAASKPMWPRRASWPLSRSPHMDSAGTAEQ